MQLFMNFDKILDSLLLCVELIIRDIQKNRKESISSTEEYLSEYRYEKNTFDLFYNLYRIYNDDTLTFYIP